MRLPGGTRFTLELAQHITSGRTPAGSPVFFRVTDDVLAQGHTVIRKDTLVEGRMQAIGDRGMVGTSGTMNFGVRYVPATDGQNIRVLATTSNKGRSRDGALIGWVFMWGIFGLTTRGVDAYALRGAVLEAEVLTDRDVKLTPQASPADVAVAIEAIQFIGARLGTSKVKELALSLERASEQRHLAFELPDMGPVTAATLTAVNGRAPAEPVTAIAATSKQLEFSLWDVLKYCDDGANTLTFQLRSPDGYTVPASYVLPVRLKRK